MRNNNIQCTFQTDIERLKCRANLNFKVNFSKLLGNRSISGIIQFIQIQLLLKPIFTKIAK